MEEDIEDGFADYAILKQKKRKGKGKDLSWQGQKDFEPDQSKSQDEKLQASRNAMLEALAEKRTVSSKNLSKGILDSELQVIQVHTPRGNHFQSIGRSVKGLLTLYLEEACFLMNMGALEVEDASGNSVTFRDMYSSILNSTDGWCSFERYQTYAYLKRLGYHVIRSATIPPHALVATTHATWMFPITTQIIKHFISAISSVFNTIRNILNKRFSFSWRLQCTQIRPLLPPAHSHLSYASVFSTLQIIPSTSPKLVHRYTKYTIDFDVHKPLPGWKKSNPGMPAFRVSAWKANEPFPTPLGLQHLLYDNRALCKTQSQKHPSNADSTFVISVVDGSEGICSFIRFKEEDRLQLI